MYIQSSKIRVINHLPTTVAGGRLYRLNPTVAGSLLFCLVSFLILLWYLTGSNTYFSGFVKHQPPSQFPPRTVIWKGNNTALLPLCLISFTSDDRLCLDFWISTGRSSDARKRGGGFWRCLELRTASRCLYCSLEKWRSVAEVCPLLFRLVHFPLG